MVHRLVKSVNQVITRTKCLAQNVFNVSLGRINRVLQESRALTVIRDISLMCQVQSAVKYVLLVIFQMISLVPLFVDRVSKADFPLWKGPEAAPLVSVESTAQCMRQSVLFVNQAERKMSRKVQVVNCVLMDPIVTLLVGLLVNCVLWVLMRTHRVPYLVISVESARTRSHTDLCLVRTARADPIKVHQDKAAAICVHPVLGPTQVV